jgi:hypothetical protein
VNEFVDECRDEWRRLGVPDRVADEMAADLAADLEEAESEGASAEEVLGSAAYDARAFAAAWASERGVVQPSVPGRDGLARRSRIPVAIAGLALVAIVGTALVILAAPSQSVEPSVVAPDRRVVPLIRLPRPAVAPAPAVWVAATDVRESGDGTRTVGSVLLITSLAGVVLLTLAWLWFGPRDPSGRQARMDDGPGRPAY